jgi:hypothetical protein
VNRAIHQRLPHCRSIRLYIDRRVQFELEYMGGAVNLEENTLLPSTFDRVRMEAAVRLYLEVEQAALVAGWRDSP